MRHRRSLVLLVLPLLLAGLAGCGGGDDSASTTTTEAPTTTTTIPTVETEQPDVTTTTVAADPEAFKAVMAKLRANLATADDFCSIVLAGQGTGQVGQPTTSDQVKDVFSFYKELFDKLAANLPAALASDADVLRDAAAKMVTDAEAKGYDPSQVPVGEMPPAFAEPEVMDVMSRLTESMGATCTQPG